MTQKATHRRTTAEGSDWLIEREAKLTIQIRCLTHRITVGHIEGLPDGYRIYGTHWKLNRRSDSEQRTLEEELGMLSKVHAIAYQQQEQNRSRMYDEFGRLFQTG